MNPDEMGLPAGEVQIVLVDAHFGCLDLGSFALVKDADTLVLYLEGVWFEAVRAE